MGKEKQNEEQIRIRAIQLYQQGWWVSRICCTLDRSRKWFYEWFERWRNRDANWFIEHSRAPRTPTKRIGLELETKIIEIRKQLVENPFMQYGP